jgi:methylase of polypeptide subunit release factors
LDQVMGDALLALLRLLADRDYRFVTPTPATHQRVVSRPTMREARSLEDVLGWSLPFRRETLDPAVVWLLERAAMLSSGKDALLRSKVRVSSLGGMLFLHSAFPTDAEDAVFFGPDSYRFARLIRAELARTPGKPVRSLVDIGTGAGVGAIVAAKACPGVRAFGTDVNARALRLAEINAAAAGVTIETVESDTLEPIAGSLDLVLANPPYIIDSKGRAYRDGGGMHGGEAALDMAREGMAKLAPGGRLILYTGAAITRGQDRLGSALAALAQESGAALDYFEIDPDVFGEELDNPEYQDVDRIAVVGAVFTRAG